MRRISGFLLALSLLLSLTCPAFASGEPEISLHGKKTVTDGDKFSIEVDISNNPGFDSLRVDVHYDEDLFDCTKAVAAGVLSDNNALFAENIDRPGVATFAVITTSTIADSGTLAKLTFKALEAGEGDIWLEMAYIDKDFKEFPISLSEAITVTVEEEEEEQVTPEPEEIPDETPEKIPEEPPVIDLPAPLPFTDVDESHWAYTHIRNVVSKGLFSGVSPTTFAPGMNVTRGMFVTVLYSAAGASDTELSTFADVPESAWYRKSVAWASKQGLVSGIGNGNFGPELSITREQLALILYQYAKGTSPGTEMLVRMFYPDGAEIHDWALTAMSWAINEGLISGKSGNRLAPQDTATRAEVAVIMNNFVNRK